MRRAFCTRDFAMRVGGTTLGGASAPISITATMTAPLHLLIISSSFQVWLPFKGPTVPQIFKGLSTVKFFTTCLPTEDISLETSLRERILISQNLLSPVPSIGRAVSPTKAIGCLLFACKYLRYIVVQVCWTQILENLNFPRKP